MEFSWCHILFIDNLNKLDVHKDSSLQLALTLKEMGRTVYLLFEEDFYFSNDIHPLFRVYDFKGEFEKESPYIRSFACGEPYDVDLNSHTVLHMRLDPPFDSRYLRYQWMLSGLQERFGVRILNDPNGILVNNEKMVSYQRVGAVSTFVGSSPDGFKNFLARLRKKEHFPGLILKPLDLFQGIGVEKISEDARDEDILIRFAEKQVEYGGPVVAQPYLKEVEKGEIRALYFNGKELGSIVKTPPEGEFLANIARGATYESCQLEPEVEKACREMAEDFAKKGVPWIAYDILGGIIQEANLTCPGLLVEVSKAVGENLAVPLVESLEKYLLNSKMEKS